MQQQENHGRTVAHPPMAIIEGWRGSKGEKKKKEKLPLESENKTVSLDKS